jgi:hypothetical protein
MGAKDRYNSRKAENHYATKKCPECFAHLPLNARVCPTCKSRVGDVDRLGFAEKPSDWQGYLIAAVCIAAFVIFVWWGFFRE